MNGLFSQLQPNDVNYSSQLMVYKDIGEEMLEHAFEGKYGRFLIIYGDWSRISQIL